MASENLVAIVTGGAQGLGYAIVKELLDNGYKVCMVDINEEKGNLVVRELEDQYGNSSIVFRVCDVAQRDHYIDVFEYVLNVFKRIDLLVNNAGIGDEENPKKMVDINLLGPIYGCEMALKYMGKDKGGNGGMVINVASTAGLMPYVYAPVYSASKHGVVALTRSYGVDYHFERSGILFCALCPYFINTELLRTGKMVFEIPGPSPCKRDDLMEPSYVARGVTKLIQDKKNGGVLCVTEENWFGCKYVGLGELIELKE